MPTDIPPQDSRRYVCVGRYRVLAHIATGGMGAVYRALDPETGRAVALKVLPPDLVAGKANLVERFRREAQAGARLRHENIVALLEFGEAGGTYFLAMELVEGANLFEHIEEHGPLEPGEAREVLIQMARALDHAHGQGIVHRDIKPANILLARTDGRLVAKLADMGLAREVRDEEFRLTREGCTVGTIDYMSPEQARNSVSADTRSDIYSLGCTFFHMLAGVPPFHEGSLPERIYQHADAAPPDIREFSPGVSADLVRVLGRMLAKNPDDRYQTPAELLDDLLPRPQAARPERKAARPFTPRPRPTPSTDLPKPTSAAAPDVDEEGRAPTPRPSRAERVGPVARGDARVAAGQFEWAREQVLRGNRTYAVELLLACCRLDPANLEYHQALRLAPKGKSARDRTGWLDRVRGFASWVKLKLARRFGNHLQVLARGAEVLARSPEDLDTQIDMAAAAAALGLGELTLWLLEQARAQDNSSPAVNRALGRYHEGRNDYEQAIAHWERVAKAVPGDREAAAKFRDLAALRTVEQNRNRQKSERGDIGGTRRSVTSP